MSSYLTTEARGADAEAGYADWDDPGSGWLAFAGVLLMMIGTLNAIEGIAAIGNAHFFVHNANYVFGDLNTWGWITLCVGVVQGLAGVGVLARNQIARWIGIVVLAIGALAALLMMPAYPLWSLAIFATGILAVYGLIRYGGKLG